MTDYEKLEARLANTERAMSILAAILVESQPPNAQDKIHDTFTDYCAANDSLGANFRTREFVCAEETENDRLQKAGRGAG